MLALSRLGYALLMLSPRLSSEAHFSLLEETKCSTVFSSPNQRSLTQKLQTTTKIRCCTILTRSEYNNHEHLASAQELSVARLDKKSASSRIAYIMHSSGSTGLPKPIYQTHLACVENYTSGYGMRCYSTVPLYHTHGHAVLYRTIANQGTIYLANAHLPITTHNLETAIAEIQPMAVFAVPYTLGLLAESQVGLQGLSKCEMVSSSGSVCPDDLGNRLVEAGVNLVSIYGS